MKMKKKNYHTNQNSSKIQ